MLWATSLLFMKIILIINYIARSFNVFEWKIKDVVNFSFNIYLVRPSLFQCPPKWRQNVKETWSCFYFIFEKMFNPLVILRSSHRRCSIRNGVLRNFAKFTGKHLCQSLFFLRTPFYRTCLGDCIYILFFIKLCLRINYRINRIRKNNTWFFNSF